MNALSSIGREDLLRIGRARLDNLVRSGQDTTSIRSAIQTVDGFQPSATLGDIQGTARDLERAGSTRQAFGTALMIGSSGLTAVSAVLASMVPSPMSIASVVLGGAAIVLGGMCIARGSREKKAAVAAEQHTTRWADAFDARRLLVVDRKPAAAEIEQPVVGQVLHTVG